MDSKTTDSWHSTQDLVSLERERIQKIINKELPSIDIETGFNDINMMLSGLSKGEMVVIGGRPAMGKSSFVLSMALNIGRNGQGIALFSLAETKQQVVSRLISIESGISGTLIRSGKLELSTISEACNSINAMPIYINDNTSSIKGIRDRLNELLDTQRHIDLVILDYIGLLQPEDQNDINISISKQTSRALKTIAKEFNVCVLVLSQLNQRLERRIDKRPLLSDLRDNRALEEDADAVCFLYRDGYYNQDTPEKGIADLIVAKQRNGPTGTIKLKFQSSCMKFSSVC